MAAFMSSSQEGKMRRKVKFQVGTKGNSWARWQKHHCCRTSGVTWVKECVSSWVTTDYFSKDVIWAFWEKIRLSADHTNTQETSYLLPNTQETYFLLLPSSCSYLFLLFWLNILPLSCHVRFPFLNLHAGKQQVRRLVFIRPSWSYLTAATKSLWVLGTS